MFKFFKKQHCEEKQKLLSAYIDGQLTPTERSSIDEHLVICKECHEELASLQATKDILKRVPSVLSPRSFAIAETRPVSRPSAFGALRLATAFAAFLLLLVGAGDFGGIYPKVSAPVPEMLATPTAVHGTPATTSTPPVATVPPKDPGIRGGSKPGDITEAPVPVQQPPDEKITEPGKEPLDAGEATTLLQEKYSWPVRQIEAGLLFAFIVLVMLTLVTRKKGYIKVKSQYREHKH